MHALLIILIAQIAGEFVARAAGLPLPGPVLGMIFVLGLLIAVPHLREMIRAVAQTLLSHLSLLFVPAGAGVVGHLATLGDRTGVILLTIVVSAVLAIGAGALTFAAVARLTGSTDD
ncbi:MAG: CidA/LrgA family protein [Rhodobacteraceae bacterium]|jgi:holin-like protein|nr:CidA/LrgA family protein [Paracoccaceae bacterium]